MDERNEQAIITMSASVTPKARRQFFWYLNRRSGVLWILPILLLLLALLLFLDIRERGTVRIGPMIYGLGIGIYAPILLRIMYAQHKIYEWRGTETTHTFFESCVTLRHETAGVVDCRTIPYAHCEALETKNALCLFTAHSLMTQYAACVILDKQTLTPEQQQALRELLMCKFGEKFKQYKQK